MGGGFKAIGQEITATFPDGPKTFFAVPAQDVNILDEGGPVDLTRVVGVGFSFFVAEGPLTVDVDIDIKPGSDPNNINLCSGGTVPVAILGPTPFELSDIKVESLRFADASVKVVGRKDPNNLCSVEDVNGDYTDDFVCHYVTADIAANDGDSSTATLNGELLDGTPFEGSDGINIVKDTCE